MWFWIAAGLCCIPAAATLFAAASTVRRLLDQPGTLKSKNLSRASIGGSVISYPSEMINGLLVDRQSLLRDGEKLRYERDQLLRLLLQSGTAGERIQSPTYPATSANYSLSDDITEYLSQSNENLTDNNLNSKSRSQRALK